MKSKIDLLIIIISLFSVINNSCKRNNECEGNNINIDELLYKIIEDQKVKSDNIILISEYVKVNYIFQNNIDNIVERGYEIFNCIDLNKSKLNAMSFNNIKPDLYDTNQIIVLSIPYFNKGDNSFALFCTLHCGNDCGMINIYFFKKRDAEWYIDAVENIAHI